MITLVPDRRSLIVLASLLTAMTLVSGLLLALEPSGFSSGTRLALASLDGQRQDDGPGLFTLGPGVELGLWSGIAIRQGGPAVSRLTDESRRDYGAYHFWIESDRDGQDGRIRISPHWRSQKELWGSSGDDRPRAVRIYLATPDGLATPTDQQIASLLWLVHRLQLRCHVPAGQVTLDDELDRPHIQRAGHRRWLFPVAQFRQQLLTLASP